jgi:hypothetical protein
VIKIQQRHGQKNLDVEDDTFNIRIKCYKMVHSLYIYIGFKRSSSKFIVLRKIMKHKRLQAFLYTFYLKFYF